MSVTVSDGNAKDVSELYINVTNENEPPEFQHDTYSISRDEGEVSVCYVSIVLSFEYKRGVIKKFVDCLYKIKTPQDKSIKI